MVTKDDISDKLNELLGLDLSFEKMPKTDLEELLKIINDPGKLIQLGGQMLRGRAREELLNRPIIDFIDVEGMKPNGPLGFGILPKILGKETSEHKA